MTGIGIVSLSDPRPRSCAAIRETMGAAGRNRFAAGAAHPQPAAQRRAAARRYGAGAAVLLLAGALAGTPARAQVCVGDCNGDGRVSISELVTGVAIALERRPLADCTAFETDDSGRVEIYELIAAVGRALNGCTAGPPQKASKSGPIAISADGDTVVAVNTDTDTLSIFAVGAGGELTKVQEVPVGGEPRSVALLSSKPWAYVANTLDGNVQVISLLDYSTIATIPVGTEPWAVVASPNGEYVYVANASSNSVSGIDTDTNTVFITVGVGRSPRALAMTNDGDSDDLDELIFAPNFYGRARAAFAPPNTVVLGGGDGPGAAFPAGANNQPVIGEGIFDDSREGVVAVLTAVGDLLSPVILAPVADTGFRVARGAFVNTTPGDAPRTIFADGGSDGTQAQATGAFPNLLMSIALFGNRAFVPNSAASPEPPLRFNVNVQSLVSVFDITTGTELADQTFNLNRGINFDLPAGLSEAQVRDNTARLFPSAPTDIDCSETTNACWVVSQGSDFIVKMTFDGNDKPTINAPTAAGPFAVSPVTRILTIDTADPLRSGRNPRGIALSADGTRGYVLCPTTRDVIVANLVDNSVVQRVRSAELPAAGTPAEMIRRGKIDFFTSRPFWSDRGWGGCWSCHPDGGSDTVTWSFEAGPRQTIPLDGTFALTSAGQPDDQRALNWSPVRDENQDFELNTRGVFGGRGFITVDTDLNGDGIMPDSDPNVRNFGPASSDRSTQQEDITAYIQFAIRSPLAPPPSGGNVARGRMLFGGAAPAGTNCVACHSGPKWSVSRVTYSTAELNPVPGTDTGIANSAEATSVFLNAFNSMNGAGRLCEVPPPGGATERIRIARQVGTFTATNPIELRSNALSPVNTTAPALAVNPAFGGDGFNPPSLLGVFETAPYLRTGAVPSLEELFGIGTATGVQTMVQAHYRAGTGGTANILDTDPSARVDLVAFLKTIDETTEAFAAADLAPDDPVFADAAALCDCQKDPPVGNPLLDCTP